MTVNPGLFIENFLEHRSDYNPQEAHDYYMRTRKLKGRKAAASDPNKPYSDEEMNAKAARAKRAKDMPKLTPAQLKTATDWDRRINKVDALFESSGLDKRDRDIRNSDTLTAAQKKAALQKLDEDPLMKKLNPIVAKLQRELLAKPELIRFLEIRESQRSQKENKEERKLSSRPGKVRGAQM